MTFLEIVQRLHSEAGLSGNAPTSVTGQTGMAGRLVNWVNDAWVHIQGSESAWDFLRGEFSFNTVADQGDYTVAEIGLTDHSKWITDTFRIYLPAVGVADEGWLVEWDYNVFRDTYRFNQQTPGRPVVFAVKPRGDGLMFGSTPDQVYTVVGEYWKSPSYFTSGTDTPPFKSHLHNIIMWKALELYGTFDSAAEVVFRAQREYSRLYERLMVEELPDIELGDSMA